MSKKKKPPRLTLIFLTCVLAVPTAACLLYGAPETVDLETFAPLLITGAVLGAMHLILRPLLRLITASLGCITLGLSGTVIDVALIYASAYFVESFYVPDFKFALFTAILINSITAIVGARK